MLTTEQIAAIYWLALELAQAIQDGNREPHPADVDGLRCILPLFQKEQADTIESMLTGVRNVNP